MIVFRKANFDSLQELWIFGLKSSFGFPSKKQIKGKKVSVLSLAKASLVMVLQLFKVN
jgi:hypothetical protein